MVDSLTFKLPTKLSIETAEIYISTHIMLFHSIKQYLISAVIAAIAEK